VSNNGITTAGQMPGFAAAEYYGQIELRDPQSSIEITAECSPPQN